MNRRQFVKYTTATVISGTIGIVRGHALINVTRPEGGKVPFLISILDESFDPLLKNNFNLLALPHLCKDLQTVNTIDISSKYLPSSYEEAVLFARKLFEEGCANRIKFNTFVYSPTIPVAELYYERIYKLLLPYAEITSILKCNSLRISIEITDSLIPQVNENLFIVSKSLARLGINLLIETDTERFSILQTQLQQTQFPKNFGYGIRIIPSVIDKRPIEGDLTHIKAVTLVWEDPVSEESQFQNQAYQTIEKIYDSGYRGYVSVFYKTSSNTSYQDIQSGILKASSWLQSVQANLAKKK